MLAGLGAGMMEAIIAVTPSETIKYTTPFLMIIKLTKRTKMIEDSKHGSPRFKGTAHGIRLIIAEEGYRGIYRGLGPVVCSSR